MIDLHCHILPALDDGARDMDDAVAMAHQAAEDGIGTICATPHIRHDHDVVIGELRGRVAEVNAQLRRRQVGTRVVTGAEVAETALVGLSDDELRLASLGGGGRWILLEPAPGPLGLSLDAAVEALERRGFGSVIAHPERHPHPQLCARLTHLVRRGALVQVTAAFLTEGEAAAAIMKLAQGGLVHLLGSDAHSTTAGRPVHLSGAFAVLREVDLLQDRINWMAHEAPRAIVAGETVRPPFPPAAC